MLGFRAIAASDGPSALAACFEHRPDLCILDVSMPAGDLGVDDRSTGFEVCRRIKRDPRTKSIPVIFVTALNDTTDRVKAIEAGGDDFLTKPHNRLVLGARVRSLLKLKAATDSLEDTLRKLREVEKMRDDLMKMIVHDLKTPLTSVLATHGNADRRRFRRAQRRSSERCWATPRAKAEDLLALIGDLLEVSRIEEATMTLDLQPIAPAALLNEIVHEWSIRFQQEHATAIVDVADDSPVFEADKALLKRVLGNLVQNALTHSATAMTMQLVGAARRRRHSVHDRRQRAGHSARVSRGHLPQVRAREEPEHSADAQLGARTRVLQARGRRARRAHLGAERRRREGKRVSFLAADQSGASRGPRHGERSGAGVKVYLRTFGCRANHYDTEAVRAMVSSAGHEIVASAADADVAVFNSCAVTRRCGGRAPQGGSARGDASVRRCAAS